MGGTVDELIGYVNIILFCHKTKLHNTLFEISAKKKKPWKMRSKKQFNSVWDIDAQRQYKFLIFQNWSRPSRIILKTDCCQYLSWVLLIQTNNHMYLPLWLKNKISFWVSDIICSTIIFPLSESTQIQKETRHMNYDRIQTKHCMKTYAGLLYSLTNTYK